MPLLFLPNLIIQKFPEKKTAYLIFFLRPTEIVAISIQLKPLLCWTVHVVAWGQKQISRSLGQSDLISHHRQYCWETPVECNLNHTIGHFLSETKQNLCHRFWFYSLVLVLLCTPNQQTPKLLPAMHHGSFYRGLIKALAHIHFVTPSVTINQLAQACLRMYCNVMQLRRCCNPIWFSAGCQVGK